jgi:hypothetical protein
LAPECQLNLEYLELLEGQYFLEGLDLRHLFLVLLGHLVHLVLLGFQYLETLEDQWDPAYLLDQLDPLVPMAL